MGGRGRGRGRGSAGRVGTSVPRSVEDDVNCGTWASGVSSDCTGCDRCSSWFHPTSLCLSVSDSVIAAIKSNPNAVA